MSITKFTEYFEGYFDNQRQAFHAPREFALIEVNHTKIDENLFRISQKYNIDSDPYRTAVVEVSETEDNKILLKSYEDTEERSYKEGCDVIFEYDADIDRFYGVNVCKECYVERNGNNTYLKTEAYLGSDYYQVSDTGHNPDTDEQVWGSYHGLFNFDKK